MNVFDVLRVNYEVFHTRMLGWLATPAEDHGYGEQVLAILLAAAGLSGSTETTVDEEVKIEVPNELRYRLADLVIRSGDDFLLVENKVDAFNQDALQISDEVAGGQELARVEGRWFAYLLIAPGPLGEATAAELERLGGRFLAWADLVGRVRALRSPDDPHAVEILRQYFEFVERRCAPVSAPAARPRPLATDATLANAEVAVTELLDDVSAGTETNASLLWPRFTQRFPDHAKALNDRYAGSRYYNAKSWFGAKLQRLAATGTLLVDTGEWDAASPEWGFARVRRYRRVNPALAY